MAKPVYFTDAYKEKCFIAFYVAGRPKTSNLILDIIPAFDDGTKPSREIILKWKDELGWDFRADELDAKAIELVDEHLIQQRSELLKKQANEARQIAEAALLHLLGTEGKGFDSSSSAVQAYFRAAEQERVSIGLSEALLKLGKMTEEELQKTVRDLLERADAANQIIDGMINTEENKKDEESE